MLSIPLSLSLLASVVTAAPHLPLYGRAGSSGCKTTPPWSAGSFNTDTIKIGDNQREYGVWIPGSYDKAKNTGLIFSYHGADKDIKNQRALDNLTDPDFNTDHIVVYLQGAENANGKTTWQGAPGAGTDDITFTSKLLDRIEDQFCVDKDRIYATGKSQGGGFVGRLACDKDMSTRFAAFAPVSGAYYNSSITSASNCNPLKMPIECNPGRHDIPLMAFHGGADPRIPYFGGFSTDKKACLPDIKYWATQWATRDQLSTIPVNVSIPDFNAKDIKSDGATIMTYGNNGLVKLVFDGWDIPHDWPSTFDNSDNDGENLASFNASSLIMDFFKSHQLTTS